MRDPNRIDKYCAELAELWHKVPDQRLGQLLCNILGEVDNRNNRDPFYIEDSEFMEMVKDIPWLQDRN